MLKDINSWQKIIFSLITLDNVYSIFMGNHCRPLAFLMSWVLSMATGKEWNLEAQGCETSSPQRSTVTATFPSIPVRHLCPTRGSNGLRDPHGFTHHVSHKSDSTCIFLNFLFRKLSVQVTGTVTWIQPLLRCLNLLILLLVFSYVDKEVPAVLVCINPTFLCLLLLLVLSSPSLTVLFYCCLQITVCKMCLSPASSHSYSVIWSSPNLFHRIWMCISLSQNTIHKDPSFSSLKAAYESTLASFPFFFLVK